MPTRVLSDYSKQDNISDIELKDFFLAGLTHSYK